MKLSKLFVLGALCLFGMEAWAYELVDREAPVEPASAIVDLASVDKTPADFVPGNVYVLYNVGTEKYYYQGNAWNTQASVSADKALLVRFVIPGGMTLADKALYLRDYVATQNQWRTAFITTSDSKCNSAGMTAALFTDSNDGGAAMLWVEANGDKTYRLSVSEKNTATQPNGTFIGVDPNFAGIDGGETGTVVNPVLAEADGMCLDWQFYEVTEWSDYYSDVDIYEKAEELKKVIEEADEKGFDVTAAVAVYNNLNATLEQLQQAIDDLKAAMNNAIGNGTAENPTDATSAMENPNFDNQSAAGWSGDVPGLSGDGNHGAAWVAEHYNKNFNTFQELAGLPNGVYKLSASTFFRGSMNDYMAGANEDAYAYLYATAGGDTQTQIFKSAWSPMNTESLVTKYGSTTYFGTPNVESSSEYDGVTYYSPNNPSTFRLYCEEGLGWYDSALFFEVSDGSVTLGVKKDKLVPESTSDWSVFDSFKLTYYGNTAESYQKWVDLTIDAIFPSYDGVACTKSYLEDYKAMLSQIKAGNKAANKAEAVAAVAAVKAMTAEELAAYTDLKENISLWAKYQAVVAAAKAMTVEPAYDGFTADISDYVDIEYTDILAAMSLTNDELRQEIDYVNELMEECIRNAKEDIKPNTDVTKTYLTNADFENGGNGWTKATDSRPGIAYSYGIAEAYDTNFDVYQDVENPKVGVYELQLQGFFRMARDNEALTMYQNGEQKTTAGVYLGTTLSTNKTYLKCVFEEVLNADSENFGSKSNGWWEDTNSGSWYPNTMESANNAFGFGMYNNVAYGLVAHEGETMRVGVNGDIRGSNWICWDNFRLIYRGYEASVIEPVLLQALQNIDTSKPMGKSVYEKADQAVKAAQAAIDANDGEQMFQVLSDIFSLNEEIKKSQELFAQLSSANSDLYTLMGTSTAPADVITAAGMLFQKIYNGINNHEFEDEDVAGLLDEIKAMVTRLNLPAYDDASDMNPIDVTVSILNPTFQKADESGTFDGWTGDGYGLGDGTVEYFDKSFDMYQDILGLPAGTYEVKCNAFCRIGGDGPSIDFGLWQEGKVESEAFLYANAGDAQNNVPVKRIFDGAITENYDLTGQTSITVDAEGNVVTEATEETTSYYVPNTMAAANSFFELGGLYENSVFVKLGQGETLRVGVVKPETDVEKGWVIMDNFQLIYYGTASEQQASGDYMTQGVVEAIAGAPVVKTEVYTLDGRMAGSTVKGIVIQKQTLQNGTVVVKKIRK